MVEHHLVSKCNGIGQHGPRADNKRNERMAITKTFGIEVSFDELGKITGFDFTDAGLTYEGEIQLWDHELQDWRYALSREELNLVSTAREKIAKALDIDLACRHSEVVKHGRARSITPVELHDGTPVIAGSPSLDDVVEFDVYYQCTDCDERVRVDEELGAWVTA